MMEALPMAKSSGGSGRGGGGARYTTARLGGMSEEEIGAAGWREAAAGRQRVARRLLGIAGGMADARIAAESAVRRARGDRPIGGPFEIGNWVRSIDRAAGAARRRG